MVVAIRCTQKLLRRVHASAMPAPSTTMLGDWYANILFARPEQLVLCVSERTLLPVVVTARDAHTLGDRLAKALREVLLRLGVPSPRVDAEQIEMSPVMFAPTQNRRILGTINSFMFQLSWYFHERPAVPLADASLWLARTPCKPIDYESPDRLTVSLFANAGHSNAFIQERAP
jgi:hypothetical protein